MARSKNTVKKKSPTTHQLRGRVDLTPTPKYIDADTLPATLDAPKKSDGRGYDRVMVVPGSTYKDSSTIIVVPSRDKMIHNRIVTSWQNIIAPMNQKRAWILKIGDEVGVAYTDAIRFILAHPELSKWKYVLTLETDNLIPADAHIRLLETIEAGHYDGVSGIYFTKGDVNMPMAYGDPTEYARTGVLDFRPRDIRTALQHGQVMPVNGIACGCSLYRLELFRQIQPPWFVTVSDVVNGAPMGFTQDLYFCKNAREHGKTFAVDMRVRVGHLDLNTDEVY